MGYFVKLDENNFVIKVHTLNNNVFTINGIENEIVANNFLNDLHQTNAVYKQTSYNTYGGVHAIDQSKAFRKNYAGIGYYYDSIRDAFIPPKPFASWILNEESCLWNSPILYPTDGNNYYWDEESLLWIKII